MSNVEAIKSAIEALPESDYIELRQWQWGQMGSIEKDWEKWDKQIEVQGLKIGEIGLVGFGQFALVSLTEHLP